MSPRLGRWTVTGLVLILCLFVIALVFIFMFVDISNSQAEHLNFVSATKGMEPGTQQTITRFLRHRFSTDVSRLAVISGPCHAEEVAEDMPAWLTVGAKNETLGRHIA